MVQMARVKEVHYFDDDNINWIAPDYKKLHSQFNWNDINVVRGEATPIYIYWPEAIMRLRDYNPNAKIIVALRHPAYRAFSHWKMEKRRGWETMPFDECIESEAQKRVSESPNGAHRVHSYVERGYYATQISSILKRFPKNNVHFLLMDDLCCATSKTLAAVEEFLGLGPVVSLNPDQSYVEVAPGVGMQLERPMPELIKKLNAIYKNDIIDTAHLTGLNLSAWTSSDYREVLPAL